MMQPAVLLHFSDTMQTLLSTDELAATPILVLGNKIDMPTAVSEQELRAALGLIDTSGKEGRAPEGVRPLEVFMSSVRHRAGYGPGTNHCAGVGFCCSACEWLLRGGVVVACYSVGVARASTSVMWWATSCHDTAANFPQQR
jgi:hypothetical protein